MRNRHAFSLLEMLMVMLMVGILSAGGLYSYAKYSDSSHVTSVKAEVAMVNTAINSYDHSVLDDERCGRSTYASAESCITRLKDKGYLSASPVYTGGQYGCTGSLYKNGTYINGTDRYSYQVSGCKFTEGTINNES